MPRPGNFRRRRRSTRPVMRLPRWVTRARGVAEGWPLRFLVVVIGLALVFRVGIGWTRSVLRPGSDGEATSASSTAPARRTRSAGPLLAEATGVATVAAILTGRARALTGAGESAARRTADPQPIPTDSHRAVTRETSEPPSPSFQRARRDFEHRHHDAVPPRERGPRGAAAATALSGTPRARRE